MTDNAGPVFAADGTPLKRFLNRALRAQKLRALSLIPPLFLFVVITFVIPIVSMLLRSVENQIVAETLPETVVLLGEWGGEGMPGDDVYSAFYIDLFIAEKQKLHTRPGTRLNYELTRASSMFRKPVALSVGSIRMSILMRSPKQSLIGKIRSFGPRWLSTIARSSRSPQDPGIAGPRILHWKTTRLGNAISKVSCSPPSIWT